MSSRRLRETDDVFVINKIIHRHALTFSTLRRDPLANVEDISGMIGQYIRGKYNPARMALSVMTIVWAARPVCAIADVPC